MGSPEITPGMQGVRVASGHLVEGQRPFDRYAAAVAPSPVIDLTEDSRTTRKSSGQSPAILQGSSP
jgi:hypothetical protein